MSAVGAVVAALTCLSWFSVPLNVSRGSMARAASGRTTKFLKSVKRHILDGLEVQAPALAGFDEPRALWSNGTSVLDVGAGSGEIPLYLQRKYGLLCRGVDVVKPSENRFFANSSSNGKGKEYLPIELFDGSSLPNADKSFDIVMFVSVLHHAANATVALLREAARVARRYIIVLEDLHLTESHAHHQAIVRRNVAHEPNGIFRTLEEWLHLFLVTPGVRDARHDMLCPFVKDRTGKPCGKHEPGVPKRANYALLVVQVQ